MGSTDVGSHPGGAKKLLTAVDGGNGDVDRSVPRADRGRRRSVPHLYLGAMANQNNASGDKHISYPSAGHDRDARGRSGRGVRARVRQRRHHHGRRAAIAKDARRGQRPRRAMADLDELRGGLGGAEQASSTSTSRRCARSRSAIRARGGARREPTCQAPSIDATGINATTLYAPERFPQILRAQTDLMVQAMACGLTSVGVIQALAAHQRADHEPVPGHADVRPGLRHAQPPGVALRRVARHRAPEFADVRAAGARGGSTQFAYLLDQLAARPEGGGTMLDHSLVLLLHRGLRRQHARPRRHAVHPRGRAGGALKTGRLFEYGYRRHSDLLATLARAMGDTSVWTWGQGGQGPLPGLLV